MTRRDHTVARAQTVSATHTTSIAAPPEAVYDLIADTGRWPYIFTPTVHVQRLCGTQTNERLRLWALDKGAVHSWICRRTMDPRELRIRFRQENPAAPIAAITGEWVLAALPRNATFAVLLHKFQAVDDDPGSIALITQAIDQASAADLAALKIAAELGRLSSKLVYSFANSTTIASDPAPVYDFLHNAGEWPGRLPHVSRLVLDETVPNVQTIEMDTHEPDGSVCTAHLTRVSFPYESIVYKQTDPPELMSAHVGRWRVYPVASGVRVTSHNTVMVRPDRVRRLLGSDATVEQAYQVIRDTVSRNNWITLRQAKHAIEGKPAEHVDQVPRRPPGGGLTPASVMQVD